MQPIEQRRRSNRLISNIDAIGFASVMLAVLFVLMVPFMITGPSHGGHDVDLAKVCHPIPMPGAKREDAIIIVVARDGVIYLSNKRTELTEMTASIQELVKSGSPKVIYFKADARARYKYVRDALEVVQA